MATETKQYTKAEVVKEYSKLTKDERIEVLKGALDYMQQYNGRSKFLCIAMAMGFTDTDDDNTYVKKS